MPNILDGWRAIYNICLKKIMILYEYSVGKIPTSHRAEY
jgi:hypothetical protein